MCGIVGLIYSERARHVSGQLLRDMCEAIVHRGPDDTGVFTERNVGLAMRRLAIVDLEGGHQPMRTEDGTLTVVFNGEIYNYPELRDELSARGHRFRTHSDTEALLHGYREWGDALPSKLNGMFAFSLWDAAAQRLLIARDHIGIKPLYLYQDKGILAWASEIKALLVLPEVEAALDPAALPEYLTFGYVPAPKTLFRGITKLPPATMLVVEGGKTTTRRYWDLAYTTRQASETEWIEEIRALVDDAVRMQLMSDVPLGAFLSGGIDSSSIVATMRRLGVDRVSTYAIGFGGEDAYHSELPKAASVAAAYETDHHEIVVEPDVASLMPKLIEQLDEPVTDTSFIVTYLISQLARESVTVILSGLGGDEIFGGYRRYLGPYYERLYRMLPGALDRRVVRPMLARVPVDRGSRLKGFARYMRGFTEHLDRPPGLRYQGYVGIFSAELLGSLTEAERPQMRARNVVAEYYDEAPADAPEDCMMHADLNTSLVDSLLAFTDKMSMAVSLETRVPLLDHRLVELAATVPASLKVKSPRALKHIFKRAMADRLPAGIVNQRKQGFGTPISRWFRGSLHELVRDNLSAERITKRGFFAPEAVGTILDDHMHQRADRSEHILALLNLELWHRAYVDR